MMCSLKDLIGAVDSLGLPWRNGMWGEGDNPSVPYITMQAGSGTSYGADDVAWCATMPYRVELYTHRRDYDLERRVEAALDAAEIYWQKDSYPIESQDVCETVYHVTVRED